MQLEQSASRVDAPDFMQEIGRAAAALQGERQRKSIAGGGVDGGLVEIRELENLAIVGDLHGDSKSLFRILSEINYEQFLSNPMNKLVFLGDYVDRGSDSVGVMYSVCHLKATYYDSVVLMKGNHEAPAEFPFSSHDLPYEIEKRFGDRGKEVYQKLLSMFRLLTLATVVRQGLLLVHGGPPTEDANTKAIVAAQENHVKSRVFEELLWNDPRQIDSEPGWENSRRGFGRHFGSGVTRKALQAFGARAIVRGHEPCQGFRLDHGDTVMTLFSCTEAYPKFKAAYLMLDAGALGRISNARDLSRHVRFPESP
ncbi:MAG TPA: metallophosphoesterase family protein [Nitrososphaera sp.]|nr:metallophosphoesterase family protein [Nitrososphaera sp.]